MAQFSARKKQIAHSLISDLPESQYQLNPFFSNLLKQPEILIIPKLGKMVVVFLYTSSQRIGWRSALAWIEDLVEVKLNVGEYVITTALVFAESDEITMTRDVRQVLSSLFEGFFLPDDWKQSFSDNALYERLASLEQKDALHEFLRQEREQVSVALRRFNTERFARLVDKDREPEFHPKQLESAVRARLPLHGNEQLVQGLLVPNIKGYLGNLGRRYAFAFELGISGRNDVAIEVIRSARYGSRERIRYLMTKARMLRYVVDEGRLFPRTADFHPILIVDGNLCGPDHDPYRYVRALLSVGWDIVGMDELGALAERLRHGYV